MCSWPLLKVQVDLHAMVQVWHAMQRLMLKTKANCHSGYAASYGYSISRPSCQFHTSGIGSSLGVGVGWGTVEVIGRVERVAGRAGVLRAEAHHAAPLQRRLD